MSAFYSLINNPVRVRLTLIIACFCFLRSNAQYYLRGVVQDENGKSIYNAKIYLASKGTVPFFSGTTGAFGIPIATITDSITLNAEGFETLKTIADASKYEVYHLKPKNRTAAIAENKLSSLVPTFKSDEEAEEYYNSGETYSSLIENEFTDAEKNPETGFSLNINRASYSNIRRFMNIDLPVPTDAVRIEEMLNYFDLGKGLGKQQDRFTCSTQLTQAPWNENNRLLFIHLKAPYINVDSTPPANLVFLMDVSGSMDQSNRLPLVKDAFKMLLDNLRAQDTVAVVIYGGSVAVYMQPISCFYKDSIRRSIDKLEASGETPGSAAIKLAYALAERMYNSKANNRIILATDGDFNVGQTSDKELEDIVTAHRQSGIYLTCLGVGMGNYKDSKLETLAKNGNGNFAYIDNTYEAGKVLVTEFSKTLYTVANDAFMKVYFNPYYVKTYRLIGYDNKKETVEDGVTELNGGDVGSGHNFTAIFEIEPTGFFNDSIMRNEPDVNVAKLALHYTKPADSSEVIMNFPVPNNFVQFTETDSATRFATAIIMFGGLLKHSEVWKNYTWDDILNIAKPVTNPNEYIQQEFLELVEKAKTIYGTVKRKKKKDE